MWAGIQCENCKKIRDAVCENEFDTDIRYRQLGSKCRSTVIGYNVVLYPVGLDTGAFI